MSETHEVSRRQFLATTSTAAAVAVPTLIPRNVLAAPGQPGANDKICLGLIGAGAMGNADLADCAQYEDVEVAAICDVWKDHLDRTLEKYGNKPKGYHDYRELLANKDVDGVIVATPHHWHCRMAVDVCEAGKDLYLEKPMSLHHAESRVIRNAVLKHKRVYQHGTQMHASDTYRQVTQWVQSGKLGAISVARCFLSANVGVEGEGFPPDGDPPADLDWNTWAGPAPIRPFNINIVKSGYAHTLWLDYGGGRTAGMSEHILDLPFWALGLEFPTHVSSVASKRYVKDNTDAPDTHEVTFEFPSVTLTWSMSQVSSFGFNLQDIDQFREHGVPTGVQRRLGYYLQGVEGTIFGNYGTYRVVPQTQALADADPPEETIPQSVGHRREWLDCIRTREEPSCNAVYAHKLNTANTLANLSMKVGRPLRFDPATQQILDDEEAVRVSLPEYRDPWKFPAEYL
ncbi:MAG: Gfo/Idh/MocA family oxidoreductase [Patescibacteria group bacterium]|nr:Gfo/Idh/MocA family oxidoreductase [Patescibacteria group bacterium]